MMDNHPATLIKSFPAISVVVSAAYGVVAGCPTIGDVRKIGGCFFFFFGVYTPDQPKAMRRPRSLPLKGLVHPRENGLHKRPAYRAKEMSKEIPPFHRHTHYRSIPE